MIINFINISDNNYNDNISIIFMYFVRFVKIINYIDNKSIIFIMYYDRFMKKSIDVEIYQLYSCILINLWILSITNVKIYQLYQLCSFISINSWVLSIIYLFTCIINDYINNISNIFMYFVLFVKKIINYIDNISNIFIMYYNDQIMMNKSKSINVKI
jgi:hypothetical protein